MMTTADAQEAPKDPELERLDKEKKKVELELEIAKKRAELLRAGLPKSEIKPLEGKISVDEKLALPSQVLAYHAVAAIVDQVSADLAPKIANVTTLVIFSERELGAVAAYGSAIAQIQALEDRYATLLPARAAAAPLAALAAPEIAATMLRSIADVAALFRTDVEIKSTTVTIDKSALVAQLASALAKLQPPRTVLYPPVYLPKAFFKDPLAISGLMKKLTDLLGDRARSTGIIAAFEAKSAEEQAKDPMKPKIPQLKTLNDQVDRLVAGLSTPDEKTGLSILVSLLKGELLRGRLSADSTRVLVIDATAAGGANKTTRNLFTGTKLFHAGGAVITVMLLDDDGTIAYGRAYWAATDFVKFKQGEEWKLLKGF